MPYLPKVGSESLPVGRGEDDAGEQAEDVRGCRHTTNCAIHHGDERLMYR